jgi:ribose transport system substrate-binding protein
VGNGFREEQVCTAKAQAKVSGEVSDLTVIHRNTDAAGQLSDIRDLIAKGVNAIVFNPNDPDCPQPGSRRGACAGHRDRLGRLVRHGSEHLEPVQQPGEVRRARCQVAVRPDGRLGHRLVHARSRRHSADTDRDTGFKNVLKDYPNIKVVPTADGVFTGWDPATTTQLANDFISSGQYDKIQGIWASGMGKQIVDAIKAANKPFVPIADADIGAFVAQLLDPVGLPGAEGRGRHQHGLRRRRRHHPGAQAPQRRDRHRNSSAPGRTPSCSTPSSSTTRPTRARPRSRHGSRSPGSTRSGR